MPGRGGGNQRVRGSWPKEWTKWRWSLPSGEEIGMDETELVPSWPMAGGGNEKELGGS